jgi:hypothetical protein
MFARTHSSCWQDGQRGASFMPDSMRAPVRRRQGLSVICVCRRRAGHDRKG